MSARPAAAAISGMAGRPMSSAGGAASVGAAAVAIATGSGGVGASADSYIRVTASAAWRSQVMASASDASASGAGGSGADEPDLAATPAPGASSASLAGVAVLMGAGSAPRASRRIWGRPNSVGSVAAAGVGATVEGSEGNLWEVPGTASRRRAAASGASVTADFGCLRIEGALSRLSAGGALASDDAEDWGSPCLRSTSAICLAMR